MSNKYSLSRTKWLKYSWLLLVAFLFSQGVMGQAVNQYSFTASSGTFTPITTGTSTSLAATADDAISTAFNIGFTFNFGGTNYTQVMASSNGALLFGTGRTGSATNNLATTTLTQRPGIAPLWDDQACTVGVKYELTGTSPNQVLTVEWLNMKWTWNGAGPTISYQVKLYETTNVVECVYRQEATASTGGGGSIGIMGATATDYLSLQNSSASPTTSTTASTNNITARPATGQVYTFTPPVPCSGAPVMNVASTSVNVCTGLTTVLTATNGITGTYGYTYQWEESPDGLTGWANVVGGTGATTLSYTTTAVSVTRYLRVTGTCTAAAASHTSSVITLTPVNCTFDVTYSASTPFTSIMSTGTVMSGWQSTSGDDNTTTTQSLAGTSFTYQGQPVTGFQACSNGWMTFNTSNTSNQWTNDIGSGSQNRILAPFWEDLRITSNNFANANSSMRYQVDGTLGSGTAVITVEWFGMDFFSNPNGTNLNFQVKLYETGNVIEYVYGNFEGFDGTGNTAYSYTTGYNGATPTGSTAADKFSMQTAITNHWGITAVNNNSVVPACNSKFTLTPGAYTGPSTAPTIAAPANDDSGSATLIPTNVIPCTSYCGTYYTSRSATNSGFGPSTCGTTAGNEDDDVWFTFVTSSATDYTLRLRSSAGYDGVLQLLDASLTPISCVDATIGGAIETINATGLTPGGTTYYIRVYHDGVGSGTTGQFSLCASEFYPPPANDNCAGALPLTPGDATCTPVNGSTLGATLSTDAVCGGNADDDVWYSFVATTDNATINVQSGAGFNAHFSVLSGTCGTLTSLACVNNTGAGALETTTVSGLTPTSTYYIRIYHTLALFGTGAFSVCVQSNCTDVTAVAAVGDFASVDGDVTWTGGTADVYIALATDPAPTGATTPTATGVTSPYNTGTLTTNTAYIAYVRKNCGTLTSNWSTGSAFDTFCPPVSGVTATLNTTTTADISWTGTNADIYIGTTPSTPTHTNVTSPYTISTPTPLTEYTYYVRSNCGGGNEGAWQGPFTYTTGCGGASCTYTFNLTDSWGDGWNGATVNVLQAGVVVATLSMPTGSALSVPVTICDDEVFELEVVTADPYGEAGFTVVAPWTETVLTAPAGSLTVTGIVYTGALDCDPPTCSTPTGLALGTFGGTTANLTWGTGLFGTPGSWEWVVVPQGEAATYTPVVASGTETSAAAAVTGLTGSTPYTFWVRANCGSPDYSDWAGGTFTTRPGNDDCADAFTATCGGVYTGSTVNSVNDAMASQCGAGTGAQSSGGVWYYFAGTDNSVTASLCGSSYDTRISIYSGSCGTLTCIGGNDDFSACGADSQTSFNAYLGTDYYILVHGFGAGTGDYTLTITCDVLCVSSNDECSMADVVPVNGAAVSADNTCATVGGDTNPGCGGSFAPLTDEWYSFNPSYRTSVGLTVTDTGVDPISGSYYYALYTGSCGSLTYVSCGALTLGTEATISGLTMNANHYLRIYTPNATFAELGTYSVGITGEALCTGSPSVGAVTASVSSGCLNDPFTLSVANTAGWSYQWQVLVGSTWTNISGANTYQYTGTITATSSYRCYVVCLPTTGTGISTQTTITLTSGPSCYCQPNSTDNTGGDYLASVVCGGINNVSGVNANPYTNYAAAPGFTTSFLTNGQYNISATTGTWGSSNYLAAWIDYNQNGVFEASEKISQSGSLGANATYASNFSIPSTALSGTTRLRVREVFAASSTDPCNGTFGETEDYTVTISAGSSNDAIANATAVSPPNYPACLNLSGNLALATDDPADVTSSGVDLWYRFTAASNACRLAVSAGTSTDTQIEIEDNTGATMGAVEDATSANGNEIYVFGGLTVGQQYWVAVRNAPSGTPGTFSLCIQSLAASTCDNGPNYAGLCSSYKARWTGTSSYTATFTSVDVPGNVYTYTTSGSSWIPLSIVPGTLGNVDAGGLQYGESYSVSVVANYNLPDANGVIESVTAVPTAPSCTISIAPVAALNMQTAYASTGSGDINTPGSNPRVQGSWIQTDLFVCGAIGYSWSVTEVDYLNVSAGLPTVVTSTSRQLRLWPANIPSMGPGKRYHVQVAPIFAWGTGSYDTATSRYVQIAGSAGMVAEDNNNEVVLVDKTTETGVFASLYPNPSNGEMVNINIAGIESESVNIRIMDASGRTVWSNNFFVEGLLATTVNFDRPLAAGVYMVEMTYNGEVSTQRLVVSK